MEDEGPSIGRTQLGTGWHGFTPLTNCLACERQVTKAVVCLNKRFPLVGENAHTIRWTGQSNHHSRADLSGSGQPRRCRVRSAALAEEVVPAFPSTHWLPTRPAEHSAGLVVFPAVLPPPLSVPGRRETNTVGRSARR